MEAEETSNVYSCQGDYDGRVRGEERRWLWFANLSAIMRSIG